MRIPGRNLTQRSICCDCANTRSVCCAMLWAVQCVPPDRNNIDTDGRYAVRAPSGSNNSPQAPASPSGQSPSQSSGGSTPGSSNAGGQHPASSPSQPTLTPPQAPKTLNEGQQCGGKGAKCAEFGACENKPFANSACGAGLVCTAQNEWYWEVSSRGRSLPSCLGTAGVFAPRLRY
jgi:hypothetical protein